MNKGAIDRKENTLLKEGLFTNTIVPEILFLRVDFHFSNAILSSHTQNCMGYLLLVF